MSSYLPFLLSVVAVFVVFEGAIYLFERLKQRHRQDP